MKCQIDTIRLRVLHTQCLTVREIAKAMNTTPEKVEAKLKELGYTPRYAKYMSEPDKLLAEIKKEPAPSANGTSSRGKKT